MCLWFMSWQDKLPSVSTTHAEFPKSCAAFTGHGSSRWHPCPLKVTAAYCWGDTHTVQAKSSYSTFFPVLLLLFSMWKVFQTNTQVQKNIAQEINLSLGRHRAKRICSTPLQISRRLVLMAMQPETCSSLNPTFPDPQDFVLLWYTVARVGPATSPPSSQEHSPQ